jgi:hypothetical protein
MKRPAARVCRLSSGRLKDVYRRVIVRVPKHDTSSILESELDLAPAGNWSRDAPAQHYTYKLKLHPKIIQTSLRVKLRHHVWRRDTRLNAPEDSSIVEAQAMPTRLKTQVDDVGRLCKRTLIPVLLTNQSLTHAANELGR